MSRRYPDKRQRRRLRRRYGRAFAAWVDGGGRRLAAACFIGDEATAREQYEEGVRALVDHVVVWPTLRQAQRILRGCA